MLEFFNYLEQPLAEMILSMAWKERHLIKIDLWGHEKSISTEVIATVTTTKRVQGPIKQKVSRVYTKITEDHDELLQSVMQRGLIQLPPVNQRNTRTTGGFCSYHKGYGHKTGECQKFRDVIQDLVDKKAISFDKSEEKRKAPVHEDNEKLGIYKNPMPQHGTGILFTQEHTKGIKISERQSEERQNEASTSGSSRLSGGIIW